jgi:hypothetical protein
VFHDIAPAFTYVDQGQNSGNLFDMKLHKMDRLREVK